eukprot:124023_1
MMKKMDKISHCLDLIAKIKNDKIKFHLLSTCVKTEGLYFYISNMESIPTMSRGRRSEFGVRDIENGWINTVIEVMNRITSMVLDLPLSANNSIVIELSRIWGGLGMRNINHLLSPISLSNSAHTFAASIHYNRPDVVFAAVNKSIDKMYLSTIEYNKSVGFKDRIRYVDALGDLDQIEEYTRGPLDQSIECGSQNAVRALSNYLQRSCDVDKVDPKFVLKNLVHATEKYRYHHAYDNASDMDKVYMHSRRSKNTLAFTLPTYNFQSDVSSKYGMDNATWNSSLRFVFNIPMDNKVWAATGDSDADIPRIKIRNSKCKRCHLRNGKHHWVHCKCGKNAKYRHDCVNKELLYPIIQSECQSTTLEECKLDSNTSDRPDMVIHERIHIAGSTSKFMLDLQITNITRKENLKKIQNGEISLFMAGKIGEREKINSYASKFHELQSNGYKFLPLAMETLGGTGKDLRHLMDQILRMKSKRRGRDIARMRHRFWIGFSIQFMKICFKCYRDHVPE